MSARCPSPRFFALVLPVLGPWVVVSGCGDDAGDGNGETECGVMAPLAVELSPNRGDTSPLVDGATVPVFPPPQGGVFTELNVVFSGMERGDLGVFIIEINAQDGEPLSRQVYPGDTLPLGCEADGTLSVPNLPVGFQDTIILQDLEGVEATLTATLMTVASDREATFNIDVVLRVTGS